MFSMIGLTARVLSLRWVEINRLSVGTAVWSMWTRKEAEKKTTREALRHVVSVLGENDVDVNLFVADEAVTETFAKGHTGQFVGTLGEAIYRATD
jgi:hypothetical protein